MHFAEFAVTAASVDTKDRHSTPGGIADAFATPISKIIALALEDELSKSPNAVIAVCGDLADKGDLDDFQRAIEFIQTTLGVGSSVSSDHIHVVPGNHDVDLKGEMQFVDLGAERFAVLQERADASGSSVIVTQLYRHTSHVYGKGGMFVHSVNSALANGAPRLLAGGGSEDPVSVALSAGDTAGILTDAVSLASEVSRTSPQYSIQESLDMPIIVPELLQRIEAASSSASAGMIVVLAHHGFLPQATPRLGPYTEMVNGGQVRRRLLQLDRPLLYLHGHIHEDVVEIVRGTGVDPAAGAWPVISISAPRLVDGFNRIEIEYAADGRVLGVVLHRIRVDRGSGAVVRSKPERIPVGSRKSINRKHRQFFSQVMQAYGLSGTDLIGLGQSVDPKLNPDEVEGIVAEAMWSGILESSSDERESFENREFVFR